MAKKTKEQIFEELCKIPAPTLIDFQIGQKVVSYNPYKSYKAEEGTIVALGYSYKKPARPNLVKVRTGIFKTKWFEIIHTSLIEE